MTDERLKMIFGFSLLIVTGLLAFGIALGKVDEQSSYGLHDVLIILATLGGAWTQWAFGSKGGK